MNPANLLRHWPIVDVVLLSPAEIAPVRRRSTKLLLDTGTQDTVITSEAARALGLQPRDLGSIRFGDGEQQQLPISPIDVALALAPSAKVRVRAYIAPTHFKNGKYSGLLGRDFLRRAELIYNGLTGDLSIRFL